jgi:hypothetical protein
MSHREKSTNGNPDPSLVDALRKDFVEIAERNQLLSSAIMMGKFDDHLRPLVDRALAQGWSEDHAREAIVKLAREYEGAKAATFD